MTGGLKEIEGITADEGDGAKGEAAPPLAERLHDPAISLSGADPVDCEAGPMVREVGVIADLQPQLRQSAGVVNYEMLLSWVPASGAQRASPVH